MKKYLLILYITVGFACTSQENKKDIKDTIMINESTDSVTYNCDYIGQTPPGNKPELFSPNFISTGKEHSAVMITPDGNEMWFGRLYPPKIWYLEKKKGKWSEIKKTSLEDKYHYLYPFLSPDGNKIYFTTDMPINNGDERLHRGDGDVWYIERRNGKWSRSKHLGKKINFGNRHAVGSVSATGNIYYTVRTGTMYNHTTNIYFAELKNGNYAIPKLIKELYSDQPSHSPYVSPDETYIIFSSFRGGLGLSDLFISYKTSNGTWTYPKNLGSQINSAAKDEYPYVTPDEKYLFFNSNRISSINESRIPNGAGNMYWVKADIIEELRPEL